MWNAGWIYLSDKSIYFWNTQKKVKNVLMSYLSQQESKAWHSINSLRPQV